MAKATGSIVVNANPDVDNKTITIDDGQGTIHSQIILNTRDSSSDAIADTDPSISDATKTKALFTVSTSGTSDTQPLILFSFGDGNWSYTNPNFAADWGMDGTYPAKLIVTDSTGTALSIRFSTSTSGTSGTTLTGAQSSGARKVSSLVYEVNGNTTNTTYVNGELLMNVKACIQDAIDNDSFSARVDMLTTSGAATTSISSVVHVRLRAPSGSDFYGPDHSGLSFGLDRHSGTWTSTSGTQEVFGTAKYAASNGGNYRMGYYDSWGDIYYPWKGAKYDSGSGSNHTLEASELADSIKKLINSLPIAITATVSGTTVSLTNDAHGTDGNVTITTNDSTNFSVSGMSGGSAESSGGGGGGTTAMRTPISAKQLALSSSGGIAAFTGSSDKPSLKMDISGLAALGASPASGDFIPVHDISSAGSVKKITVAELIGSVAAGSDTQVQFNDGGSSLGGDSGLTYNKTTDTLTVGNDLKLSSDAAVLNFGADDDVTLTHVADTGLLINSSRQLQFGDSATHIKQVSDGLLEVEADTAIQLDAPIVDFEDDGVVLQFGADDDVTLTHVADAGLMINSGMALRFRDSAIEVKSSTDGQLDLAADAEVAVVAPIVDIDASNAVRISNDLELDSDAAVLKFGNDSDVSLTHVADTGLLLNSSRQLQFGDSGTYIHQSADGVLDLVADSEIEINATTIDVNGAMDVSGNCTVGGNLVVNGTTVTVNSTTVTVDDPIITLGGDSAPSLDDNKDRGVEFRYHDGTSARVGFMGWDDSAEGFTILSAATNSSEVFSGTAAPLVMGALTATSVAGSTGTFSGVLKTDDTTEATSTTDGSLQTDGGLSVVKSAVIGDDLDLLSDAAIINFGADKDVNLTHVADTGLLLNSSMQLQFGDSGTYIHQSADGVLDLVADSEIEINATTIDMNGAIDASSTITAAGRVIVDDTTEATSTTDGSLQTDGGLSVAKSAVVGDDLDLLSDAAIINFGADKDVNLTHVADTGLLLNSSMQLQFGDSGTYIHQSADGVLDLVADTEIEINASTIDMNGDVDMSAGLTVAGASVTFSALADLTNSDVASGDKFIIQDASASGVAKEITFDNVAEKMAGAGIANTSGVLSIAHQQDTYISGGGSSGLAGQVFTLTQTPASADAVSVYINGLLQARSGSAGGFQGERDYNISGTTLTLVSSNALSSGDELVVRYIKS